jgi:hypothetical protein
LPHIYIAIVAIHSRLYELLSWVHHALLYEISEFRSSNIGSPDHGASVVLSTDASYARCDIARRVAPIGQVIADAQGMA